MSPGLVLAKRKVSSSHHLPPQGGPSQGPAILSSQIFMTPRYPQEYRTCFIFLLVENQDVTGRCHFSNMEVQQRMTQRRVNKGRRGATLDPSPGSLLCLLLWSYPLISSDGRGDGTPFPMSQHHHALIPAWYIARPSGCHLASACPHPTMAATQTNAQINFPGQGTG